MLTRPRLVTFEMEESPGPTYPSLAYAYTHHLKLRGREPIDLRTNAPGHYSGAAIIHEARSDLTASLLSSNPWPDTWHVLSNCRNAAPGPPPNASGSFTLSPTCWVQHMCRHYCTRANTQVVVLVLRAPVQHVL